MSLKIQPEIVIKSRYTFALLDQQEFHYIWRPNNEIASRRLLWQYQQQRCKLDWYSGLLSPFQLQLKKKQSV